MWKTLHECVVVVCMCSENLCEWKNLTITVMLQEKLYKQHAELYSMLLQI